MRSAAFRIIRSGVSAFDLAVDDIGLSPINGTDSCTGDTLDISPDFTSWWSGNPAIATVTKEKVQAVSPGATTASSSGRVPVGVGSYCTVSPAQVNAPVTVTGNPDHLSVIVDNEGYPAQCPTTGVYLRQMNMQVVDINNNAVTNSPSVTESYSGLTTNTCGTGQPVASECATAASGQFIDSMGVSQNLCNSGVKQSSGCGYSLTSTWSACSTSGSNALWVSPRVTHSNGVEIDGAWTQWPASTKCTKTGCN